ncbi:MAG: hypothetical protein LQ352_007175 [Teloschistes flavicans]|nr:MAG: hypothetical protein LQ352_007175 [Teloschistes flavicans]
MSGYLEQAELNPVLTCDDGSIKPGDAIDECGKLAIRAGESFGKSLMVEEFMQDDIRRAGFTNVVKTTYKWPIGAWSNEPKLKELGRFNLRHWNEGLEGWTLRFYTKYLGWTYEEVKKWNANMRHVLRDRKYHAYQNVQFLPLLSLTTPFSSPLPESAHHVAPPGQLYELLRACQRLVACEIRTSEDELQSCRDMGAARGKGGARRSFRSLQDEATKYKILLNQQTQSLTLAVVQVATAVVYCLFAAGIVFGYAALKPVLLDEGVYRHDCPKFRTSQLPVDTCYEQEIRYKVLRQRHGTPFRSPGFTD